MIVIMIFDGWAKICVFIGVLSHSPERQDPTDNHCDWERLASCDMGPEQGEHEKQFSCLLFFEMEI